MTRPTLGQKVEISAEAHKVLPGGLGDDKVDRHWARREFDKPLAGIYIGYRFVYEGEWKSGRAYEDYYEENYFHRTGQHELWLVVTNPRHNPIYVWPNDVTQVSHDS